MTQQQEHDLINRAQAGSVAAYEQIVKHYQDRLLRFLMMRGLQMADAEDTAQTAFVRAWQNLTGYQSKWRFSTWLYTIARRSALEQKPLPNEQALTDNTSMKTDAELDPCLTEQLRDNVWSVARNQLDASAFQALWLHYAEGFSGKETARIMQRSTVWVRVTLHRARKQLRNTFASNGYTNTNSPTMVEQHEH